MKKLLFILLLIPTLLFAQNTVNVNAGNYNKNSYTSTIVTEQQSFYHGEFYWNHGLNTSTGAFTSDASKDISDYMPILPSTSITMSTSDSNTCYIYGWTYDANYAPIAEIRSNVLVSTKLQNYTFTTPSNAAYLVVLTKSTNDSFNLVLRIKSTNTITYSSPIVPEQFAGTQTQQIQQAEDFARFTSSPVYLGGVYGLDSAIILSSGSKTLIGGRIFMNVGDHDNVFRNEAVANPSFIKNRGNRDISIIGIGNAVIEGSKEKGWGSSYPVTVPSGQYWRANAILLANVDIFLIKGITFKAMNASAIVPEQCRNGLVTDITMQDGLEHLNQGGIIIGTGNYNITVSNFSGVCFDDIVAIQNIPSYLPQLYILGTTVNYLPYTFSHNLDVFGIKVSNINRNTSSTGSRISIRAAGGFIHDCTLDNITGYQPIWIQDNGSAYGVQAYNQVYNLSISNTGKAPIYINNAISKSSFINVAATDTSGTIVSCALKDTSSRIYRQYIGQAPVFVDSVYSGTEHSRTLN